MSAIGPTRYESDLKARWPSLAHKPLSYRKTDGFVTHICLAPINFSFQSEILSPFMREYYFVKRMVQHHSLQHQYIHSFIEYAFVVLDLKCVTIFGRLLTQKTIIMRKKLHGSTMRNIFIQLSFIFYWKRVF